MTNYINNRAGNPMPVDIFKLAEALQEGQGDGRLSKADAEKLAAKFNDGGVLTDRERTALEYVYYHVDQFNFTKAGREQFVHEMRSGAAQRGWKTRLENMANAEPLKQGQAAQSMIDAMQGKIQQGK